jgi:hypothetical protein
MTQSSIQSPVTIQELLISSLAQTDALAKLLIEKGLITREEFGVALEPLRCPEGHLGITLACFADFGGCFGFHKAVIAIQSYPSIASRMKKLCESIVFI